MGKAVLRPFLPYITNPFQLIFLVPQPLLISSSLYLLLNASLYLSPIFTTHLFIELFFTLLFLLAIHIWVCDLILSLFKKHSTFYPFLFIAVLLFVSSEALLFLSCLWVIISYL